MVFPFFLPFAKDPNGTPASPAQLRVIGIALLMGAMTFAAVAVGLPFIVGGSAEATGEPMVDTVQTFSLVNLLLTPACLGTAIVMGLRPTHSPEQAASRRIQRWAILEGAALFGVVVVLLGGLNGVLPGAPLYYANLIPLALFAAIIVTDLASTGARP
ncbi:MAG: hypothetical protein AAFZ65_06505 [Planctomycetota bacterium]